MAKTSGRDQPVTIDGATLALLPTPQKIDLKTADDVKAGNGEGLSFDEKQQDGYG